MVQHVIFDMDGTLFQTNKILEVSLDDTFQYLNLLGKWEGKTPITLYRNIMGVPLPEVWDTLLPKHSKKDHSLVNEYFLQRLIANIHKDIGALYPNVETLFQWLKEKGYNIYIASNGLSAYLQAIVSHYRLDQWVTETSSIESIPSLNKTDLVKSIVNKYNIQTGVVIGDRLSDFQAAKGNNLLSVGCAFDFSKEVELAQADVVIHDLLELPFILQKEVH